MKKLLITIVPLLLLTACTPKEKESGNGSNMPSESETTSEESENEMILSVDGQKQDVTWESNPSVKALDDLGELTISMHRYGGFEQVGSIGHTIISDDVQMTTNPGDIVLYSSNQLVIFFGSNSWAYTKLGHINLNQNELKTLLDKPNVEVTIK